MKKIISALVVGAVAAGIATADLKIGGNYRNGATMFQYSNTRESGQKATKKFFDLMDWQNGSDSVTLQASGNILSFKAQVNPQVDSDNNNFTFKYLTIGANVGNFTFESGFYADGVMNYRVKTAADREFAEGKVFETYKLGSTLGGLSSLAENQVTFSGNGNNYYAQAGYKLGFGESVSLGIKVAALSNYKWSNASDEPDSPNKGADTDYLGWSVFLNPELKGILGAELFAKGLRQDESNYGFVFGGYAKLLCLPILADSALGGAVGMYGGKVNEWSADLRLYFTLGDSIMLTTMNNFTKVLRKNGVKPSGDAKKDLGSASGLAGLGSFNSSQLLWDVVSLRFKLNDTLAIIGTVGQQTDFDSGSAKDGTQVYVYPHMQIYAASNASIVTGVVAAFNGLGAHKDRNKNFDILVSVPLTLRVQM